MIELMIKNIFENSNKIDVLAKHINKLNKKHCLEMLLVGISIYSVTKVVEKHEEKINNLMEKVKEIELKGE